MADFNSFKNSNDYEAVIKASKWTFFDRISSHMYILTKPFNFEYSFAPLYIFSAKLLQPHYFTYADKFIMSCKDPKELNKVSDKLHYYRFKSGLMQQDVADNAGIDRVTYSHYESGHLDNYSIETLKNIAKVLDIDLIDLLDEYNLFLYNGQGVQVRKLREKLKMSQIEFGVFCNTRTETVKQWEEEKRYMSRRTWERIFKSDNK